MKIEMMLKVTWDPDEMTDLAEKENTKQAIEADDPGFVEDAIAIDVMSLLHATAVSVEYQRVVKTDDKH